ncbi:sulfatase-like hydrolase/transferase [Rhodopirellula halodulae]|uniref:sulfatase-like hydrolase/transferase n=1 Tax=Rhodopirellula halodulae TaxID=2894198 RepID=UPI001E63C7B9|nr:sulfatase-like hydrolase/transferase [Rhodopirellula sp. JC737]MCC9658283.1 sulfatase-like hydrolase/transferase [Rhodopirellula sp. JC737]
MRFLAVAALALISLTSSSFAEETRPNIVLIMADDIGIEGLGCYGGTSYKTPVLDQLASEGMRFTHAYAQPLCTPTRVQLMTGKYNHRNWKYFGILPTDAKTFGHRMKEEGYATGIFGKWQLQSYDPPGYPGADKRRGTGMHPKDTGFDEYALFHALHTEDKGSRYANPTMLEGRAGQGGELKTYDGAFGEDIWVDKTIDFLKQDRDEPAFVYYPMALPHWPFVPTPINDEWDPTQPVTEKLEYFPDMVQYMDMAVGRLLDGLRENQLRENTIVIFYSDNGTHLDVVSQMDDGRAVQGGKGLTKQTGIHVPLIVSWPVHIKAGVSDSLIDASDFFPTLVELAGGKVTRGKIMGDPTMDGVSFAPELFGQTGEKKESLFFWYDPRPGEDKSQFAREVFALNRTHKVFRDGRAFRLTKRPLEEIPIDPDNTTDQDKLAIEALQKRIADTMTGVAEPPLVDATGQPISN